MAPSASIRHRIAAALLWTSALAGCTDGRTTDRLYVTSGFTDEVWILDAASGRQLDVRSVDRRRGETDEPHGVAVSPDAAHWYVTVSHGSPTLWKYESEGDRLVGRVDLEARGAARVGITPDGALGFVPDYLRDPDGSSGEIVVVRLSDLSILARAELCAAPHHAAPDPTGQWVAVTCAWGDEIVLVDAATLEPSTRFAVGDDPGPAGRPRHRPMNAVWGPGGDRLYVTLMGSDQVRVFDRTGSLIDAVGVGTAPAQLDRFDSTIVVANRGDLSISVLDTEPRLQLRRRIELPGADHPHGVTMDGTGSVAYVAYEGTTETSGGVIAVDLDTGRELWRTELGSYVLGIARLPATLPTGPRASGPRS